MADEKKEGQAKGSLADLVAAASCCAMKISVAVVDPGY